MSKPAQVLIRQYKQGDEARVNDLHNRHYNKSRGAAQWKWEFQNGPCGESVFVVAECDGRIVGTQALLPIQLCYGGKTILSAKAEETLLDPDFRGQGLFQKLYDKCFELAALRRIEVIWAFTNARKPYSKCGFAVPARQCHEILVLHPDKMYRMYAGRTPALGRRITGQVLRRLLVRSFIAGGFLWSKGASLRRHPGDGLKIVNVTKSDTMLDDISREFSENGNFYTVCRDSGYLDWRIFQNPNLIHQVFAVAGKGYVIAGVNEADGIGYIVDLCVLKQDYGRVAGPLLEHAIAYLRTKDIAFIDAWYAGRGLETKKYTSCLGRHGFVPLPLGSSVVLKVLAAETDLPADPADMNQWFITNIFSDGTG